MIKRTDGRQDIMKEQIQSEKKEGIQKTAALFNDSSLQSIDMFMHCSRIPDVMARIVKAREVLKKYRIQPPAWMFGLVHKGEVFESDVHLRLMSFLISLGLYGRLIRLMGVPDFLLGTSQALLVSAKMRTFEKNVIQIFCGAKAEQDSLRIYQKQPENINRFSLLYFMETAKDVDLHGMMKKYEIDHCILVSPSFRELKSKGKASSFTVKGLIEMDPKLAWFWPILKRKQLREKSGRVFSGSLDTFFN